MTKYIEVEKLKKLLETEYKEYVSMSKKYNSLQYQYIADGLDIAEQLIDTLQQEPTPDTLACHTELVNLLKRYRIGEETASTMADRIADTYGAQRYMDGLCDGLNMDKEDTKQGQLEEEKGKFAFPKHLYARTTNNKTIDVAYGPQSLDAVEYVRNDSLQQEQPKLYKDESLGSPDYERGFKHGRDYQTDIERKYTNKDKVVAYLVDKGYPVNTKGEIPTYQETFDMAKNAIEYANQQEQPNLDDVKREWYNKGYLKGRKDANIPARELGLPKSCDIQEQPEVDLEKEIADWIGDEETCKDGKWTFYECDRMIRHFYELGLNARKK